MGSAGQDRTCAYVGEGHSDPAMGACPIVAIEMNGIQYSRTISTAPRRVPSHLVTSGERDYCFTNDLMIPRWHVGTSHQGRTCPSPILREL
jgi:hypothetical protein